MESDRPHGHLTTHSLPHHRTCAILEFGNEIRAFRTEQTGRSVQPDSKNADTNKAKKRQFVTNHLDWTVLRKVIPQVGNFLSLFPVSLSLSVTFKVAGCCFLVEPFVVEKGGANGAYPYPCCLQLTADS
jgi:hypothetical protein